MCKASRGAKRRRLLYLPFKIKSPPDAQEHSCTQEVLNGGVETQQKGTFPSLVFEYPLEVEL